jgi:alpha-tubulin suppressor-like RCC1 family protein
MHKIAGALMFTTALVFLAAQTATASDGILEWGRPVGTGGPGLSPVMVQPSATQIDAGNYGDVLLENNGTVWMWGAQHAPSMTLTQVTGVNNVTQRPVDGNGSFAAIEQPGTDAACPSSSSVVQWSAAKGAAVVKQLQCLNVVQLAKAAVHTYALTATGEVYVWGGGQYGVLGLGASVTEEKNPTLAPALTALTDGTSNGVELTTGMASGGILVNGIAYSWGSNLYGQCGCDSTVSAIAIPTPVAQDGVLFTDIDDGGNLNTDGHELALTASGTVYAWGDNQEGQLGIGTLVDRDVPVLVPGLPTISDVRAGGMHSLALDADGNVWAWGDNQYGQVGDGTTSNVLSPEKVLSGANLISAGSYHSIAQ